jgi:hypothetical protein
MRQFQFQFNYDTNKERLMRRLRRLRRRLWSWYNLVSSILSPSYYPVSITLTYAPTESWERRDISLFLDRVRKYYKRRGWRFVYFWVAELQQRGAVHYHVVLFVPRGHMLPKPDLQGWWRKGMTHIMAVEQFAAYFAKYIQKGVKGDLEFPKRLRLFGYGGLNEFERGMYRCFWLPYQVRRYLLDVLGVFLVLRKRGGKILVSSERGIFSVSYIFLPDTGDFLIRFT